MAADRRKLLRQKCEKFGVLENFDKAVEIEIYAKRANSRTWFKLIGMKLYKVDINYIRKESWVKGFYFVNDEGNVGQEEQNRQDP